MFSITCVESFIDENNYHYGCFQIEPLTFGQGLTLGNTLRRILLSDIVGTAITSIRINNIQHEFSGINGVREDVLDLILNLKEIRFRNTKLGPANLQLKVIGPTIVTAEQLLVPKHIEIVNNTQYIATVLEASTLEMELKLEQGTGCFFANKDESSSENEENFLMIDAIFSPIKKVNFRIKLLSQDWNDTKELLIFEIWTDGSITPARSLKEATKIVLKLFSPLLINEFKKA